MPPTMSGNNFNNPDFSGRSVVDASSRPTPRTRKQPVRTYGKRSAQSREIDAPPPAKKRKLEDATPAILSSPRPPEVSDPEPPSRGSILSYFKPLRSSSSIAPALPSDASVSEPSPPPPPSSPTLPLGIKKRRRLTTRPEIPGCDISAASSRQHDAAQGGMINRVFDEHNDALLSCRTETGEPYGVLEEVTHNALDQMASSCGGTFRQYLGEKKKKNPIRRRSTKDMVQTTLSLGINPGPGYTVCRDCGMLYNPMNEKDRVDHRRQHVAHVKERSKIQLVG